MRRKSIYRLISKAVNADGVLEPGFELPDEAPEEEIKWAAGAQDGVMLYHMLSEDRIDPEDEHFQALVKVIEMTSVSVQAAVAAAEYWAGFGLLLPYSDPLMDYIMDHQNEWDQEKLWDFARQLTFDSEKKEGVKLGLAIMRLYDTSGAEDVQEAVRTLALSDEFALYAGHVMLGWDEPDEAIFRAIKKVRGWGRIHLIRLLEKPTEEMTLWLLENGADNEVMPAYSALDLYVKTDFMAHLGEPMDHSLYAGMAKILAALLDEGPVPGISAIGGGDELIRTFLEISARRYDLDAADYDVILDLKDYLSQWDEGAEGEGLAQEAPLLLKQAEAILGERAREAVIKAMAQGNNGAFNTARRMGIDYKPYAYQAVKDDFAAHSVLAYELIREGYRAEELLRHAEEALDLRYYLATQQKKGRSRDFVPDELTFIVDALRTQPGLGENFIKTALNSPNQYPKFRAVKTLEGWIRKSGRPLSELSPRLYEKLEKNLKVEDEPKLREKMQAILDNQLSDDG